MKSPLLAFAIAVLSGVLLVGASACSPRQSTIVPFPLTSATPCAQEEIGPKITEIRPAEIKPGSEVTVIATGGYFRDTCGGYHEDARTYKIYVDNEPIADLSCYVHHCEGKFVLPESIAVGSHCMGVQKGACQLELHVAAK